jgi:hypothetical protein
VYHSHPAAAAARGSLDQHRQLRFGDRLGVEFVEHGHAGGGHELLGLDLGAHRPHRIHRRPNPGQARVLHGGSEFGVLRKESVSRMDGVGTRGFRGCDQLASIQVAVAAVEAHRRVGLSHVG